MSTFGGEVRRLRREANMTQDGLAAKLGVTRSTVSQIESGKNLRSNTKVLRGLERALGLTMRDALLLMAGEPYNEIDDWQPDPGDRYGLPPRSY